MQITRARAWIARRFRRRLPFAIVMVLLVGGATALTGAGIGGLAWNEEAGG